MFKITRSCTILKIWNILKLSKIILHRILVFFSSDTIFLKTRLNTGTRCRFQCIIQKYHYSAGFEIGNEVNELFLLYLSALRESVYLTILHFYSLIGRKKLRARKKFVPPPSLHRGNSDLNLGALSKLADPDIALCHRGKCQLSSNWKWTKHDILLSPFPPHGALYFPG